MNRREKTNQVLARVGVDLSDFSDEFVEGFVKGAEAERERFGMNQQEAPFPEELQDLVNTCELDPGWKVMLIDNYDRGQGSQGLTLVIQIVGFDTYHPERGREYRVNHLFPVPPASFNRRSWQRWLFDRYLDVLSHEGCEWFKIDGVRPYAPHHGPGNDPYIIWELGTREDQLKRFDDPA